MKSNKPLFISFEGGEGSGKSTQSKMLFEYLKSRQINAILTREIGGTIEAEKIRNIVLHSELLPTSELMMVMAARYEHVHKLIIPAINSNNFVICDRFVDSSAAYQGQCQHIGIDKVYHLHNEIIKIMPDITFFIDISPEIALQRTHARGDNNKFEDKKLEFHLEVYSGFKKIAKLFKKRIISIKAANLPKEQIHQKIVDILLSTFLLAELDQ